MSNTTTTQKDSTWYSYWENVKEAYEATLNESSDELFDDDKTLVPVTISFNWNNFDVTE